MVFDGVKNEGNISNVDVNRKMLKFQTMHIQNMLNNQKNRKSNKLQVRKKRVEIRKITNELKTVKEAKQKFTEQHKEKTAKLGSQIFNLEEHLRNT